MKVSLIVVQGKPEGKVIPLAVPRFKIGRGEGCHLRPNNEQVSRNHAEIDLGEDTVILRDLGSRNGTYVNSQRVEPNSELALKNKDLVQIGPLTFAVSIQGVPVASSTEQPTDKAERAMAKAGALDELSNDDIDSWLVTDKDSAAPPERPSGVYTGDTMTFSSYQEASKSDHQVKAQPPEPEPEVEDEPEREVEDEPEPVAAAAPAPDLGDDAEMAYDKLDDEGDAEGMPEELIDESNPFYAAKKQAEDEPAAAKKKDDLDSSQVAEDILRKMMERRRATR